MVNTDWLNAQAAYLFRQAAAARRKGNTPLADALTAGACRCLDRISEYENTAVSAPVKRVQEPQAIVLLSLEANPLATRSIC